MTPAAPQTIDVGRNLTTVRDRIAAACARSGREAEAVRIVAVTKEVPPDLVRHAAQAGQQEFGENYVQELEVKRGAAPQATWHFVGRLQRNKVPRVLELADVVQTLEPGRAAQRLADLVEEREAGMACLLQVDFTGSRVGVSPEGAEAFLERIVGRSGLRVEGLMTVAPLGEPPRPTFGRLRELRDRLAQRFSDLRELSMGMSADYEEAVEEGATMVRVGTALFGPRPPNRPRP